MKTDDPRAVVESDLEMRRQLGDAVQAELDAAGVSQTALAAELKRTRAAISQVLRGDAAPNTRTIARLAEAVGLDVELTFTKKTTQTKARKAATERRRAKRGRPKKQQPAPA